MQKIHSFLLIFQFILKSKINNLKENFIIMR